MQCPRCQGENRAGRRFCGECGLSLALRCPACGFLNEGGEKFCGGCGAVMMPGTATPRPTPSPQSYTPRHLAERILTSRAALGGERRTVVYQACMSRECPERGMRFARIIGCD